MRSRAGRVPASGPPSAKPSRPSPTLRAAMPPTIRSQRGSVTGRASRAEPALGSVGWRVEQVGQHVAETELAAHELAGIAARDAEALALPIDDLVRRAAHDFAGELVARSGRLRGQLGDLRDHAQHVGPA